MLLHVPLFETIIHRAQAGQPIALCAVIKTRGSAPQSPGAMLVVDEGMNAIGTLGGGCVEAEVCKQAHALLRQGQSRLLAFQLDHDSGWDDGLICGGGMDIAVMPILTDTDADQFRRVLQDVQAGAASQLRLRVKREDKWEDYLILVEAEPTLVIAGAGHVGTALARLCVDLEFDVTVIDDRADFANAKRLSPPIRPIIGDIEQTLRRHNIDRSTYVVIVTRGHNHDEAALSAVIDSPAKYVGMIGSRRKIKVIYDNLRSRGVKPELLERVHSPIGVAIKAVTVPEIAVSIAAELISVRRADARRLVEGPLPVTDGNHP